MNALQTFDFNGNSVRSIAINDEPWWILKDVCIILGIANPGMVSERLDSDEKRMLKSQPGLSLNIPNRGMTVVNESGLYSVIIRSDSPIAKSFKRWLTHEVLPSIRKSGAYSMPGTDASADFRAELERKVDRLTDLVIQQSQALFAVQTHLLTSAGVQSKPRQVAIVRQAGMRPVSSFYGSTHKVITAGFADEVAKMYRSGQTQKAIATYLQSCGVDITDMSVSRFIRKYMK